MVLPLGVEAGSRQKLTLRGLNVTNATAVRLTGLTPALTGEIKDRGAAAKIDGFDTQRVGDQRLEVELSLPANTPTGTNIALVVVSPDGESNPSRCSSRRLAKSSARRSRTMVFARQGP